MKVRFKFNHWLPSRLGVTGITLYPYVLLSCSKEEAMRTRMIHHEWVHVEQVRKLGWVKFYVNYLWQYIKLLFRYRNREDAYFHITHEMEAYGKQRTFVLPEEALKALE